MKEAEPQASERTGLAVALVLAAALIFALSDAASKRVVATLPIVEMFWIRCVVVTLLTAPVVVARRGFGVLRTRAPLAHVMRTALVLASSMTFLTGLVYLPLAEAAAINFIWPVLITILSVIFLGERVGVRRGLATLAGFIGMLVIMRPGSASFQAAAVFPLLAAATWAGANVLTRVIARQDAPETTIIWSALLLLLASTLALPFFWRAPTLDELGFSILIGIGSALGHAAIVVAYGRAPASSLAHYSYLQLVFAALCGYAFFGSIPDRWVVLGSLIIVASGLYTIHRERVRRLERHPVA